MSLQGPQGGWVGWAFAWGVWGMCGAHSVGSGATSRVIRAPRVGTPANPPKGSPPWAVNGVDPELKHLQAPPRPLSMLRGCGARPLLVLYSPQINARKGAWRCLTGTPRVPAWGWGATWGPQQAKQAFPGELKKANVRSMELLPRAGAWPWGCCSMRLDVPNAK